MALNGTIQGDNKTIDELNAVILELKSVLSSMEAGVLKKEAYVERFEDFILSFDSGNDAQGIKGDITIKDEMITVLINGITTKISSDGTVL